MALPLLAAGAARILAAEALEGGEALSARLLAVTRPFGGDADPEDGEITVPVASSAIRAIGYKVGGIITVDFVRGGSYDYMGSEADFIAFLMAPSKGQWFNQHFR